MSMRYKLILLGLLPGIAILAVLLALVSVRMQSVVDKDMEILRDTLLDAHKTELRNSLDIAARLSSPSMMQRLRVRPLKKIKPLPC
jgi:methyl-accepting chemotaxis protein